MQIARFEASTSVEGPGIRSAVWFQGCSILCENCCNPRMQAFSDGESISAKQLHALIMQNENDGLTLLGGEPLDQAASLFSLLTMLKDDYRGDIILFTGYTWQELQADQLKSRCVGLCDLVVAGPYLPHQASSRRRWVGSDNQTLHFMSSRLVSLQNSWPVEKPAIEIVIRDGAILVNGSAIGSDHELEKIFSGLYKE